MKSQCCIINGDELCRPRERGGVGEGEEVGRGLNYYRAWRGCCPYRI